MIDSFDLRQDAHSGAWVYLVADRQRRPNLPEAECPFCPGGLEAPEPYDVRWFKNRWPALPGDCCEVLLYSPDHEATFASLGPTNARRVIDLWASRSAELGARPDVDYVLVFENRGAEVGATIGHPHGQIYAFPSVPEVPARELNAGTPFAEPGDRIVSRSAGWQAWVPEAPQYPYSVIIVPDAPYPDLPSLTPAARSGLAMVLVDVLGRFDRVFGSPAPYMLWIHQRPFSTEEWPETRVHVEIVSPWRGDHVMRYIAAGELGSGVFFNPVSPTRAAETLRGA